MRRDRLDWVTLAIAAVGMAIASWVLINEPADPCQDRSPAVHSMEE